MQIKFRGNRVAVEKIKKQNKKAGETSFLVMPDSEEYVGIIRYLGESADQSLKIGQKVYFTTQHQITRIGGSDLCVMDDAQILAVVDEDEQKA